MIKPLETPRRGRHQVRVVASAAFLAAVMAAIPAGAPAMAEGTPHANPNLPVKTLGGGQVWADITLFAGWRIQRNVLTGHARLLDPDNVRRAWGSVAACDAALKRIKEVRQLAPSRRHLVLLIHGIAPLPGPFNSMETALRKAGFDAVAISYPSTRGSIEEHAAGIAKLLGRMEGARTVSFVTHSMGGLVVRHLLAAQSDWMSRHSVGRIVQIAPPNQGAALARWASRFRPYSIVLGEAGMGLRPAEARNTPELTHSFAIIAGGKNDRDGFNPLITGDDDGVVRVSETWLPGASARLLVPANHAFLTGHPRVIKATTEFLKHGMIRD